MKKTITSLRAFIESVKMLGLREQDLIVAEDFLKHNELGLCFETIINQLYEYDIEIDEELYEIITKIAYKMTLPTESYSFMKDLVRSDNDIPKNVKEQLIKIMNSLTT